MTEEVVITEAINRAIGVESEPVFYEIEKGWLKRFADAVDDPNPLWQDEKYARKARYGTLVAAPTFIAAIRDMEWIEGLLNLECPLKRVLNGGNEIEFYEPIKPGDTISVRYKLTDAKERQGKTGKMLFLTYEANYSNQFGDIVARGINSVIRY